MKVYTPKVYTPSTSKLQFGQRESSGGWRIEISALSWKESRIKVEAVITNRKEHRTDILTIIKLLELYHSHDKDNLKIQAILKELRKDKRIHMPT